MINDVVVVGEVTNLDEKLTEYLDNLKRKVAIVLLVLFIMTNKRVKY